MLLHHVADDLTRLDSCQVKHLSQCISCDIAVLRCHSEKHLKAFLKFVVFHTDDSIIDKFIINKYFIKNKVILKFLLNLQNLSQVSMHGVPWN